MKRRKDYSDLNGELQVLEIGMHEGNKQYDDLRKRLVEIGNADKPITKTLYWHWLVERDDFPERYFYATPPIGEANESNKILITGTKAETGSMYEILMGIRAYQNVTIELQNRRKKFLGENIEIIPTSKVQNAPATPAEHPIHDLIVTIKSLEQQGIIQPDYVFSGSVASFWEKFFGKEGFLDHQDKISVPRLIIGTGYIRTYNKIGGATLGVKERLEEIASAWNIPIKFIETWHF